MVPSVIITPGEKDLIAAFDAVKAPYKLENLLVGDAHIRSENGTTLYIFERKAKGDLDASIKDGRYREQKSRLVETGLQRDNIIYIIEQLSKPRDQGGQRRLWSAMCNMQHRDRFRVFQTRNVAETVEFITGMVRGIEKVDGEAAKATDTDTPQSVITINVPKKKVNTQEWFKYSLSIIQGCSVAKAESIIQIYPTFGKLREAFEKDGPKCLANIKTNNRRLGDILSARISETILAS